MSMQTKTCGPTRGQVFEVGLSVRGENVKTVVYNLRASTPYTNSTQVDGKRGREFTGWSLSPSLSEMETCTKIPRADQENFITVVSVGPDSPAKIPPDAAPKTDLVTLPEIIDASSGFVTVLTIGDGDAATSDPEDDATEQVLVYRLPGERLGFGLKFEGGTRANEFVKRLFIQSCAPDSPASRVQSSWGSLTEGDEVLEIDCIPVDAMTRIDCVRCLKDSNVVIKLLVKHSFKNRSVEDLPQVVSAEKKRTPPPPPPVPPRKIPKKFYAKKPIENVTSESPVPAVRHNVNAENTAIKKKFQSPRSSGRSSYSPDIPRRDRRLSDGSLGPPNAQVYVDLFSQESTLSLSESDDTGSSISTVVDRFASFPTTTASSLAGSLPSTPTSVQRHLDFSNLIYDDEEIISFKPNVNSKAANVLKHPEIIEKSPASGNNSGEDGSPLQPPSCFQDAPLSYGNEDMRLDSSSEDVFEPLIVAGSDERKVVKKPPVPPRAKDFIKDGNNKEIHDENMNISNLPRLVDFVPKTRESFDNPADMINEFLDNERRETDNNNSFGDNDNGWVADDDFSNEIDLYSSKWSLSSQLATIGEVEEESPDFDNNRSTPIVIVQNADCVETDGLIKSITEASAASIDKEFNGKMETLPSDSRQPPDGHEFPDYVESAGPDSPDFNNCQTPLFGTYQLNVEPKMKPYSVNPSQNRSSFTDFSSAPVIQSSPLNKMNSVSNSDLSCMTKNGDGEVELRLEPVLHARSQSLIDMSAISKQKHDRWSIMVEQRRKGLSKLKGLVIPEHIAENEVAPASVTIPEIITAPIVLEAEIDGPTRRNFARHSEIETTISPSKPTWPSPTAATTLPKYSPAFKRKSLQVYPAATNRTKTEQAVIGVTSTPEKFKSKSDSDELSDAPKSLESITSPTRSDCSFDYLTSSFKSKMKESTYYRAGKPESPSYVSRLHKDLGKSEDESDNDSAVSSSQSSYVSRCSPPPSPTRSVDMLYYESSPRKSGEQDAEKLATLQSRLLKAASVEAINRKNILASAKCRSGRDLKVGSPVIQRKLEENGESSPPIITADKPEPIEEIPPQPIEKIVEKPPIVVEEPKIVAVLEEEKLPASEKFIVVPSKPPLAPPTKVVRPSALPPHNKSLSGVSPLKIDRKLDSPRTTSLSLRNEKSMSVTDLRKSFEKFGSTPPTPLPQNQSPSAALSSKKRPAEMKKIELRRNKVESSVKPKEKIGAIIKTVTKSEEKTMVTSAIDEPVVIVGTNRRKIILSPKFIGGSIGITLAGGTDYETKEITVHKIRHGSVAQIDGQLKKGDKIISINGKNTGGKTHAESVDMLKETVAKFVLIVEDSKGEIVTSPQRKSFPELKNVINNNINNNDAPPVASQAAAKTVTHVVGLIKDGPGLGFSMEGGKDSPQGDLPLTVKKIFQGGAAEKSGDLSLGDEILAINDISVINMTKIEVWNLMKKLPDGNVSIHIHR